MEKIRKKIARLLIRDECVQISPEKPFTYTSGLRGPIYCDNRKVLSHITDREIVAQSFVNIINESRLQYDHIAGLATAGIPHAAFVADRMKKSMLYIRSSKKEHGKNNQVEGSFKVGEKIILIEDLVNQAKSLKIAFDGAKEAGLSPEGCFSIVDYQMKSSREILNGLCIPLYSLTNFSTLVQVALDDGIISKDHKDLLYNWQQNPAEWHQH